MLPKVAKYISQVLAQSNVDLRRNHHIVGHSLGAHMAGQIGRYYYNYTCWKPFRITGLDPGSSGYFYEKCSSTYQSCEYLPTRYSRSFGLFLD